MCFVSHGNRNPLCPHADEALYISYCFGPINNTALMNRIIFRNLLCSAVAFIYIFFSHPKKLSWPNFLIKGHCHQRGRGTAVTLWCANRVAIGAVRPFQAAKNMQLGQRKCTKILPTSSRGQTTVAGQRRRGKWLEDVASTVTWTSLLCSVQMLSL